MRKDARQGVVSPTGAAVLLLRLVLGVLFLAAGMGWLTGATALSGTVPAGTLAAACAHALSYAEFAVGVLLMLGFCTRWAFLAGALVLTPLTVGMLAWQDTSIAAGGVACLILAAAGVRLVTLGNPLSLDLFIEQTSDRLFNMK